LAAFLLKGELVIIEGSTNIIVFACLGRGYGIHNFGSGKRYMSHTVLDKMEI
jgi:hypothetical protein